MNDEYIALLGKQVRVTLAHGNAETGKEAVIAEGKFVKFGDGGEFVVVDEMGFAHYCWPLLDIEPAAAALEEDQPGD